MHSWYTIEKTVAVINACNDHALYQPFGGSRRQERPDYYAGDNGLIDKSRNPGSEHVRVLDLGIIANHS